MNSLARMDIGRPATFCLQHVQLHIHAAEFDYLCQSIEPAPLMCGNPRCARLPGHCLVAGPQKVSGVATFWPVKPVPGAAENLVLPLYRMVVQHMKNQILTEVTGEFGGGSTERDIEESERRGNRK